MFIYLSNNSTKFHPDPIWNDGDLGFSEDGCRQQQEQAE